MLATNAADTVSAWFNERFLFQQNVAQQFPLFYFLGGNTVLLLLSVEGETPTPGTWGETTTQPNATLSPQAADCTTPLTFAWLDARRCVSSVKQTSRALRILVI